MVELAVLVTLLVLGYGFGSWAERSHYRSILEREARFRDLLIFSARLPPEVGRPRDSRLVTGSVVVSVDYFKSFVAGLRSLVGGRLTTYETLLDRGRREAILRMKAEAAAAGASRIFNVKIETASISKGGQNALGSVEVLAYGTALKD